MPGPIIVKILLAAFFVVGHKADDDVSFKLLTSYDSKGRELSAASLAKTSINPLKRVIFLMGCGGEDWYDNLASEYFNVDNYNLFIGGTESKPQDLGDFLAALVNKTGERYLDFHLLGIGEGFGATREAGRRFLDVSGRKVNRITGLLSGSSSGSDEETSEVNFADFVDVVHADVKELKREGYVDFYIDGAFDEETTPCNQLTAVKYYSKSIGTNDIKAKSCESVEDFISQKCASNDEVIFGENVPKNTRGTYFLQAD